MIRWCSVITIRFFQFDSSNHGTLLLETNQLWLLWVGHNWPRIDKICGCVLEKEVTRKYTYFGESDDEIEHLPELEVVTETDADEPPL